MMLGGICVGIDLVTISRIAGLLEDYPDRFRDFGFSQEERQYCDSKPFPPQHYAARWALKEAFIKAVGLRDTNPDLTTITLTNKRPPELALSGEGFELLKQKATTYGTSPDNTEIDISIAHESKADLAVGLVVIIF